jgi:hypothetical protein
LAAHHSIVPFVLTVYGTEAFHLVDLKYLGISKLAVWRLEHAVGCLYSTGGDLYHVFVTFNPTAAWRANEPAIVSASIWWAGTSTVISDGPQILLAHVDGVHDNVVVAVFTIV